MGLPARMLWGPWQHPEPPWEPYHNPHEDDWLPGDKHDNTSSILSRVIERRELEKRATEYLNLVEAQTLGPSSILLQQLPLSSQLVCVETLRAAVRDVMCPEKMLT